MPTTEFRATIDHGGAAAGRRARRVRAASEQYREYVAEKLRSAARNRSRPRVSSRRQRYLPVIVAPETGRAADARVEVEGMGSPGTLPDIARRTRSDAHDRRCRT